MTKIRTYRSCNEMRPAKAPVSSVDIRFLDIFLHTINRQFTFQQNAEFG